MKFLDVKVNQADLLFVDLKQIHDYTVLIES